MTFINSTHSVSALLALFVAISLISSRALNPLSARILGAYFLFSFVQHMLAAMIFSDIWPQATVIRAHLALLFGPVLYLYFKSVLTPKMLKLKHFWFHFLAVPILTIVIFSQYGYVADLLIISSFLGYFCITLFQYWSPRSKRDSLQHSNEIALRWLDLLLGLMLLNLILELGIIFEIFSGIAVPEGVFFKSVSLLAVGFHIFALVLVLTRAPLLEWMHELKGLPIHKSHAPKLSEQELQEIFNKWEELVTTKELFLYGNGITVSRAAKLLGVPSRQLSQTINTIYGASFSQYLNDKRVDRAKELLRLNSTMSITEVYLAAGFGTKSHFHREFSRSTKMTPSEFKTLNQT